MYVHVGPMYHPATYVTSILRNKMNPAIIEIHRLIHNIPTPPSFLSHLVIEEIMMIITDGMISDHVIGGQNVIRFGLYLFGKCEKCSEFYLGPLRGTEPITNLFQRPSISP
jgi:hypothetical protein